VKLVNIKMWEVELLNDHSGMLLQMSLPHDDVMMLIQHPATSLTFTIFHSVNCSSLEAWLSFTISCTKICIILLCPPYHDLSSTSSISPMENYGHSHAASIISKRLFENYGLGQSRKCILGSVP